MPYKGELEKLYKTTIERVKNSVCDHKRGGSLEFCLYTEGSWHGLCLSCRTIVRSHLSTSGGVL